MNSFLIRCLFAAGFLSLGFAATLESRVAAQDIWISANANASSFPPSTFGEYIGPAELAPPLIRRIEVAETRCTEAVSGPWFAMSHSSAIHTGAFGVPSSLASFRWNIAFEDNQAIRDLITLGGGTLDFNVHFNVGVTSSAPGPPGLFNQSQSEVGVTVHTGRAATGRHTITNESSDGPAHHVVENSGVLEGLPENGGDTTFAVTHEIAPKFGVYDFDVEVEAQVSSRVFSINPNGANAEIGLSLADGAAALTLLDGTPLLDLGVLYDLGVAPGMVPDSLCRGAGVWDIARLTAVNDLSLDGVSAVVLGSETVAFLDPKESEIADIEAGIPTTFVEDGADKIAFIGPDQAGNLVLSFPVGTVVGSANFQSLFSGWTVSEALDDLDGFLADPTVQSIVGSPVPPMGGTPTPMELIVFDLATEDSASVGAGMIAAIPEPSTFALGIVGLLGLAVVGLRRRHSSAGSSRSSRWSDRTS